MTGSVRDAEPAGRIFARFSAQLALGEMGRAQTPIAIVEE
jgi:hypothetical protein